MVRGDTLESIGENVKGEGESLRRDPSEIFLINKGNNVIIQSEVTVANMGMKRSNETNSAQKRIEANKISMQDVNQANVEERYMSEAFKMFDEAARNQSENTNKDSAFFTNNNDTDHINDLPPNIA